jgi:hypothetical protein
LATGVTRHEGDLHGIKLRGAYKDSGTTTLFTGGLMW